MSSTCPTTKITLDLTGTFVGTNAVLTQSPTKHLDGAYSLLLTCSGTTPSIASSGYYPVLPSTQYTYLANFIAGATARSCAVQINWYTSAGALISSSWSPDSTDSTSAWIQIAVTATSPSTAAYAGVEAIVIGASSSELHYVDEDGLFLGTVSVWSLGIVAVIYNDLYRFVSSEGPATAYRISTDLAVNGTVVDYSPASGVDMSYYAVAVGLYGSAQGPTAD
jgi:hypothetical protein